jgi:hypothetical protein
MDKLTKAQVNYLLWYGLGFWSANVPMMPAPLRRLVKRRLYNKVGNDAGRTRFEISPAGLAMLKAALEGK